MGSPWGGLWAGFGLPLGGTAGDRRLQSPKSKDQSHWSLLSPCRALCRALCRIRAWCATRVRDKVCVRHRHPSSSPSRLPARSGSTVVPGMKLWGPSCIRKADYGLLLGCLWAERRGTAVSRGFRLVQSTLTVDDKYTEFWVSAEGFDLLCLRFKGCFDSICCGIAHTYPDNFRRVTV